MRLKLRSSFGRACAGLTSLLIAAFGALHTSFGFGALGGRALRSAPIDVAFAAVTVSCLSILLAFATLRVLV